MRTRSCWLVAVASLALATSSASAIIVNLTHSSIGSGTLNGVPFSAAAFTITGVADSANRTFNGSAYVLPHTTSRIFIQGLGTFDYVTPTISYAGGGFVSGVGTVGFGAPTYDLVNGPDSTALYLYDFLTDIGPITGRGNLLQWNRGVNTSGGVLFMSNANPDVTFTGDAVPAPASALPLALGVLALRRRRALHDAAC